MGIKITRVETASSQTVFKSWFISNAIAGIFTIWGAGTTRYYDEEYTKRKWQGALLGLLAHLIIIGVMVIVVPLEEPAITMGILGAYIIGLILFGIFFKLPGNNPKLSKDEVARIAAFNVDVMADMEVIAMNCGKAFDGSIARFDIEAKANLEYTNVVIALRKKVKLTMPHINGWYTAKPLQDASTNGQI